MNQSFEEEYRSLAQSELPDLWDRIEAGISRKNTVSVPFVINENEEIKENKKSVLVLFRRYQTVAAAFLCLIILVPAFLVMHQISGGVKNNSEAARDADPPMAMYAAEEEAFSEVAKAEESVTIVTEATEEAPAEETTMSEVTMEESTMEESIVAENDMEEMKMAEKATEDAMMSESAVYHVTLMIISMQDLEEMNRAEDAAGNVYKCCVLQNEDSSYPKPDTEIVVWFPEMFEDEMQVGESFEADLIAADSEDCDYEAISLY